MLLLIVMVSFVSSLAPVTAGIGSNSTENTSLFTQQKAGRTIAAAVPSSAFVHPDVAHITTSPTLSSILHNALIQHNLVGAAAVVVKDGRIVDRGAAGLRKSGHPEPVTLDDLWHIGSCTKSFCSALVGLMVDQGRMTWSTTIGEVFPELIDQIHPAYHNVTVKLLLEHRGGAPLNSDPSLWNEAWQQIGTPTEQRLRFVTGSMRTPPQNSPNTTAVYSNTAITIAGAMVEKITGVSWETMAAEWVARPLGINSVGHGAPGDLTATIPNQPLGHSASGSGGWTPMTIDNPPAIAPAATIHIKADDLARWLIVHCEGERGAFDFFMSSQIWNELHTPPFGRRPWPNYEFALGWLATDQYITHTGSNTMWCNTMWADTSLKHGLAVFLNVPDCEAVSIIVEDIIREIINAPTPPPTPVTAPPTASPPAESPPTTSPVAALPPTEVPIMVPTASPFVVPIEVPADPPIADLSPLAEPVPSPEDLSPVPTASPDLGFGPSHVSPSDNSSPQEESLAPTGTASSLSQLLPLLVNIALLLILSVW